MKYLAIALISYAAAIYSVSWLIDGKLSDTIDDARRFLAADDAVTQEIMDRAGRAKIVYGLVAGSILALIFMSLTYVLD